MQNDPRNLMPGDRVLVYDWTLFKNDVKTPCKDLFLPATIIKRYGQVATYYGNDLTLGPYPDQVDVLFDHRPNRVSEGHFTDGVKSL